MYFLIHQNTDLCDVSGYAFTSVSHALRNAEKRIGLPCVAVAARVFVGKNVGYPCFIVRPAGGSTELCREGQMILIAEESEAMSIAMRLTRRNKVYGDARVEILAPIDR